MEKTINHSLSDAVPQLAILQFPGILFMILYWIFTGNEDYYTSDCIELLSWSEALLYISDAGFFLSAFCLPIMYFALFNLKSLVVFKSLEYFYLGFTIVYMIGCLVIFAGICYSYSLEEPCGELRSLNCGYIITYSIEITLVIVWGIIVVTCTYLNRKIKKKNKEIAGKIGELTEKTEEKNEEKFEGKNQGKYKGKNADKFQEKHNEIFNEKFDEKFEGELEKGEKYNEFEDEK